MNKLKLQAKLIDLGVLSEDDTIRIEVSTLAGTVHITIITDMSDTMTFSYHDNKLTYMSGSSLYIADVEKMKTLDLEEFE
jgi:hypothetical protein